MKTFRLISIVAALSVTALLSISCNRPQKKAMSTAKAFLQAYYLDLDFEKAFILSSDASHAVIADQAEIMNLNPYAKEETPEIVIEKVELAQNNSNAATCTYTCNRVERRLPLIKLSGRWIVNLEGKTIETAGFDSDFIELSPNGINGFTSATSGKISYRQRRQSSK
ncbi:MAG: hypothetical protein NC324_08780 [Bacteroides sp.]|nr:hypothetical protein [Bacteroides sp.]